MFSKVKNHIHDYFSGSPEIRETVYPKTHFLIHSVHLMAYGLVLGSTGTYLFNNQNQEDEDSSQYESQVSLSPESLEMESTLVAMFTYNKIQRCMSEFAVANSYGGYFCRSENKWYYVTVQYGEKKQSIVFMPVKRPSDKSYIDSIPIPDGESIKLVREYE